MRANGLRPYPAYRNSGLGWLGEVPKHWELRRGKTVFRCIDERSETGSEELLTVSSDRGIVPRDSTSVTMFKARSYVGHKLCWPGDLVINSLWAWSRGLGVSRYHGIVSTAYGVYRVRRKARALPDFIHALVRSEAFNWELRVRSKGIWISRLQLTDDSFLRAPLLLPPISEQGAIVRFLNAADRRIRRYIRAKERLVELLEERKRALVHEAVTGRIDVRAGQPYPAYKDSGVEWLGKVPEHWEVAGLGYRYEQCLGKMLDRKRITGECLVPYLRNADVQWDEINVADLPRMDIHPDEIPRYTVQPGDLLVCEGGEVGRCAIWKGEIDRCGFQKALHRLRPRDDERDSPRFLYYALSVAVTCGAFADGHESTIAHLTGEKLRRHRFAFPCADEQVAIVGFLDDAVRRIRAAISATQRQIELLREYRTRLIADVVTGKLDVRETADAILTESRLHSTAHEMAKEAIP